LHPVTRQLWGPGQRYSFVSSLGELRPKPGGTATECSAQYSSIRL
jgi:hypothetical protein